MGRLILPFAIGLLLGLGGSTGVVVTRAKSAHARAVAEAARKPKPVKPDSTATVDTASHADSAVVAHNATAPADSAKSGAAPATAAAGTRHPMPVDTSKHAAVAVAAPPKGAAPTPAPVATKPAAAPAPAPNTAAPSLLPIGPDLQQRRLAKIFGAMQPKEAAQVLEQMEDADVRTILSYLPERQAAAVLGNFSAARAARISSATLRAATRGRTGTGAP